MRQDLRVQTDRDTLHTLSKEQRELNRQMNRLVLTTVIGLHPLGGLGIEDCLQRELGEARLNITRSRSSIACEDVSPVTLTVNEQIFLAELDECVSDRSITVRVVLHGLTDDVRHLVVLTVIHLLHSMQDTALHGFEAILNRGHSTL